MGYFENLTGYDDEVVIYFSLSLIPLTRIDPNWIREDYQRTMTVLR